MTVKRTAKVTTRRTQPKRRKQTKQLNPRSAMPKVPKSVKNAYDLLGFVQQVIREEPRRYNQGDWVVREGHPLDCWSTEPVAGYPSCGTVGCIAGWVTTLRGTEEERISTSPPVMCTGAERILGLSSALSDVLFAGDAVSCAIHAQTPEHAEAGVAHIEAFRQKYKTQLQGQPV